jgi:hypothetical protein
MRPVLGFNVEAKNSDVAIQRVKLDLGDTTAFYNHIYSTLYVTDGSNVLASTDLDSSTVVKDGTHYYVTLTGFNLVVPKNTKKQIVIKADLFSSIDSAYYAANGAHTDTYPIALATDGVRAIDGAGIDQYGGSTSISRTPSISESLSDNAALKVSLDNSTPATQDVVAADGSNNDELDRMPLLAFDLKAEKDDLTLNDFVVDITYSDPGGKATATTVYLYDGSTELDNASVVASSDTAATATFTDLGYVIPKDTTKTLTLKVDVRDADGTYRTISAKVDSANMTDVENSAGDQVDPTGVASGYAMSVRNAGVEITLVSKSITTNGVPQGSGSNANSTSTLTATFNVKIKAVGNDVYLGTVGSTSNPLFASTGASNSFQLFKNGVASNVDVAATSTSYTIPSTCTTDSTRANTCVLAEGSEVTVPVTYMISGRTAVIGAIASGLYSVELQKVNWNAASYSNFMDGLIDWRTADVSFP